MRNAPSEQCDYVFEGNKLHLYFFGLTRSSAPTYCTVHYSLRYVTLWVLFSTTFLSSYDFGTMFFLKIMVKFLSSQNSDIFFNCLSEQSSALLSSVTGFLPSSFVKDGVFAVQYVENMPVSAFSSGDSFSLLFTTDKSDVDELSFSLQNEVHSPNLLPFRKTGEYYLLKSVIPQNTVYHNVSPLDYDGYKFVLSQNGGKETENLYYLFKKGLLLPFVQVQNEKKIGGGFISNSENYSLISHVFVKEEYRGRGYGKKIVKNLLMSSESRNVYLTSEENNLAFYGKIGFEPVLTVNKYNT